MHLFVNQIPLVKRKKKERKREEEKKWEERVIYFDENLCVHSIFFYILNMKDCIVVMSLSMYKLRVLSRYTNTWTLDGLMSINSYRLPPFFLFFFFYVPLFQFMRHLMYVCALYVNLLYMRICLIYYQHRHQAANACHSLFLSLTLFARSVRCPSHWIEKY
jgi:hypothetical protein